MICVVFTEIYKAIERDRVSLTRLGNDDALILQMVCKLGCLPFIACLV